VLTEHASQSSWVTRVDDSIVVCHARQHEDDLTGILLNPECDEARERLKTEDAESEPLDAEDAPLEAKVMPIYGNIDMRPVPPSPYWIPPFARPWWNL
jgi:hypothetical protein